MIQTAVAPKSKTATAEPRSRESSSPAKDLLARFHQVRDFSSRLTQNLAAEDCVVQSMPEVSPTKWHLAHTTWFFETFILKKWLSGYRDAVPEYAYLFNSYYNAAGAMHRRDLRGMISRPTVEETKKYRASVDADIDRLISGADEKSFREIEPILTLGIHHERQHQELLVTDIKHVFAQNPLYPVFQKQKVPDHKIDIPPAEFVEFAEATVEVGHDGNGFCYDNELPRHRALVLPFALANRLVTNAEYLEFMNDNGYSRPEFWLSLGWTTVNEQNWRAPLYWIERDGEWLNFTLSGLRRVEPSEPVTHLSSFEADAYAKWAGARLPTEFEWEVAASSRASRRALRFPWGDNEPTMRDANVDQLAFDTAPVGAFERNISPSGCYGMIGDVWEWTSSDFHGYPGFETFPYREYSEEFFGSEYKVLRGGSWATRPGAIRNTFRNWDYPIRRQIFSGFRCATDG